MVLSMTKWVGKVAIVTGAASGIGAAIANRLTKSKVIVTSQNQIFPKFPICKVAGIDLHPIEETENLHPFQANIAKEEDILRVFDCITTNLGPVNILVNCAGIADSSNNLIDGKTKVWKAIFDVNVLGLCMATREALNIMICHDISGHIVNLNSMSGRIVFNMPNMNVYPASKHAVTAIAETFRNEIQELGLPIKVTNINPGFVDTKLNKGAQNEEVKAILRKAKQLKVEDIADGIIYALSTPEHVQVDEITVRAIK